MALNNINKAANSPNVTASNVNSASANDTLNTSVVATGGITTSTQATAAEAAAAAAAAAAAQNENLAKIRIDENSADNLEALFAMALNQKARPLQVPFRMRNLPDSFFNPPSTGSKSPSVSHTRENSVDSAFGSGTTTICSPNGNNGGSGGGTTASAIGSTNVVGTGGIGATKLNGTVGTANATTAIINPLTSRLQISHSRAHSSPASLQQTYAGLNASANANPIVAQQVCSDNNAARYKSRTLSS